MQTKGTEIYSMKLSEKKNLPILGKEMGIEVLEEYRTLNRHN
jgi:hypothetical protein